MGMALLTSFAVEERRPVLLVIGDGLEMKTEVGMMSISILASAAGKAI
jgi:hypothetical protein